MKKKTYSLAGVLALAFCIQCAQDGAATDNHDTAAAAESPSQSGMLASKEYTFSSGSDEIWMNFTAVKGRVYTIATGRASLPSDPEADTVLVLYDSAMKELARNDDARDGMPQFSLDDFKKDPFGHAAKILSMSPDRIPDGYFSKITWKAPFDGLCRVKAIPHDGYADSLGSFSCTVSVDGGI